MRKAIFAVFTLLGVAIPTHAQDFSAEVQRLARAGGKAPADTELDVVALSGLEQLKGLSLATARIASGSVERN